MTNLHPDVHAKDPVGFESLVLFRDPLLQSYYYRAALPGRRRARVNDELKVRQTRRRQTGTYLDTDRSYYGRNSRVVVSVLP